MRALSVSLVFRTNSRTTPSSSRIMHIGNESAWSELAGTVSCDVQPQSRTTMFSKSGLEYFNWSGLSGSLDRYRIRLAWDLSLANFHQTLLEARTYPCQTSFPPGIADSILHRPHSRGWGWGVRVRREYGAN